MDWMWQMRQREEQSYHSFRWSNWKDGVVPSEMGKSMRGKVLGEIQCWAGLFEMPL